MQSRAACLLIHASMLIWTMLSTIANARETAGMPVSGDQRRIAILWAGEEPIQGSIEVHEGRLAQASAVDSDAIATTTTSRFEFQLSPKGSRRIELTLEAGQFHPGPGATRVTIRTTLHAFTFFARDVTTSFPVWMPEYGIAVSEAQDARGYEQIARDIQSRGLKTACEQLAAEPEETWAAAAARSRVIHAPTLLGVGRDFRTFWIDTQYNHMMPEPSKTDSITASFFGEAIQRYPFMLGIGVNSAETMTRSLEEGSLPILHGRRIQDAMEYAFTAFTTLEASPLVEQNVRGTHYLAVDYHAGENSRVSLTPELLRQAEELLPAETDPGLEQTVLYFRAEARNAGNAPRYAYMLVPNPNTALDAAKGYYLDKSGERVQVVATINGRPLPNEELSILLQPGESAVMECRIPHQPIDFARADQLAKQDYASRLDECRAYWKKKLNRGARLGIPEAPIHEYVQAGLLHLDLLCFGREPEAALAACTGYAPIGSESAPVIQFLDSMGRHDLAERGIDYFLEKQHPNGFMQNYKGYEGEVGPVLWTIGEHYRYTRDDAWVRRILPRVLKSCEYLIEKRRAGLALPRGRGYGMITGKMADPDDPFPSYMLNSYACLGLERIAEMLATIEPTESERLRGEAAAFRADIRDSFMASLGEGPAVPLGNGAWRPTSAPWTDAPGARALYAEPGQKHIFTHGSQLVRDCLLGVIHLPFTGIIASNEPAARWLGEVQTELYTLHNVAPTQPYYSRNDWLQLRLGNVPAFLKGYYNTLACTLDRETATFQEHAYGGAPHKTHEEAWFLMQTRWMLYLEDGDALRLLAGVPRKWLEAGKQITLERAASYFGPINLRVESKLNENLIEAEIGCESNRAPRRVVLRVPHPEGKKATRVEGGHYDAESETVTIDDFNAKASIRLWY